MVINFLSQLINNVGFKILVIVIILDSMFGILRAIKERKVNSAIGIDGIIRKVGMLFAILGLALIDYIIDINLVGFIPESIRTFIHLEKVGIATLFNLLFIIFEFLSVLKNMIKCKLPIPKKLQTLLEKALNEFTNEMKTKGGENENG